MAFTPPGLWAELPLNEPSRLAKIFVLSVILAPFFDLPRQAGVYTPAANSTVQTVTRSIS